MDDPLRAAWQERQEVGVGIAEKEHTLEEQHASRPYPRTTAKPRQDEFANDRLNLEEQKGAEQTESVKEDSGERSGWGWHAGRQLNASFDQLL